MKEITMSKEFEEIQLELSKIAKIDDLNAFNVTLNKIQYDFIKKEIITNLIYSAFREDDKVTILFLSKNGFLSDYHCNESNTGIIAKAMLISTDPFGVIPLLHKQGIAFEYTLFEAIFFNNENLLQKADLTLIDKAGNTVLHYVAAARNKALLEWLLLQPKVHTLITMQNRLGQTCIHLAAIQGDTAIARILITHCSLLVNQQDAHGYTPLMTATLNKQLDFVQYLIEQQANVALINTNGNTALHHAAQIGHIEIATLLIKQSPDLLLAQNNNEFTPLMMATINEQLKFIDEIDFSFSCKIDTGTESTTPDGAGMLHLAVHTGNLELVTMLADYYPAMLDRQDNDGYTPLMDAIIKEQVEMVQLLLSKQQGDIPVTGDSETLLHLAARVGNVDIAELLFINDFTWMMEEQNKDEFTPFFTAIWEEKVEFVKYLISKDGSIIQTTVKGQNGLHIAARIGAIEIAQLLTSEYPKLLMDKNERGQTPLVIAALNSNVEMVDFFLSQLKPKSIPEQVGDILGNYRLESKAMVEKLISSIESPSNDMICLKYSIINDHLILVKRFINRVMSKKKDSGYDLQSLFYEAVKYGAEQSIYYFLEQGANIKGRDRKGNTALIIAAQEGEIEVLEELLKRGATLYEKDEAQATCLHNAAYRGQTEMVIHLLKKGMSITETDKYKRTPLYRSVFSANPNVMFCLALSKTNGNLKMANNEFIFLRHNLLYNKMQHAKNEEEKNGLKRVYLNLEKFETMFKLCMRALEPLVRHLFFQQTSNEFFKLPEEIKCLIIDFAFHSVLETQVPYLDTAVIVEYLPKMRDWIIDSLSSIRQKNSVYILPHRREVGIETKAIESVKFFKAEGFEKAKPSTHSGSNTYLPPQRRQRFGW
jgi:ankyrin repeat protein